jgi:hypothetical protein
LSNPRALSFHEILWADGAPSVEKLATEWYVAKQARIRVSDPGIYKAQMRRLLGLD